MNDVSRSNEESLCEKSMQVVINIIKLSSLSFTKMMSPRTPTATSLLSSKNLSKTTSKRAAAATTATTTTTTTTTSSTPSSPTTMVARPPKSLKSQKEVQKPVYHLFEPVEDKDKSVYVINGEPMEKNVDGMASDYIKRVYEKIHIKSPHALPC